jgi:hypothetical protein
VPFSCDEDDDEPARAYVVEYATFRRRRVFESRELVTLVSTQFLTCARRCVCAIVAYRFESASAHMLIETYESAEQFAREARFLSACVYEARYGGSLWSRDYRVEELRPADVRGVAIDMSASAVSGSFAWHRFVEVLIS